MVLIGEVISNDYNLQLSSLCSLSVWTVDELSGGSAGRAEWPGEGNREGKGGEGSGVTCRVAGSPC